MMNSCKIDIKLKYFNNDQYKKSAYFFCNKKIQIIYHAKLLIYEIINFFELLIK